MREGRIPRVSIGSTAAGDLARQLEAAIAQRLGRSGLFRFDAAGAGAEFVGASAESLSALRADLAEKGVDIFLAVEAHRVAGRLVLLCRVYSATAEHDGYFSITSELEPDLALLLQHGAESGEGGGLLILTAPLPDDLLDLAAAEVDGVEGDELIALTGDRLLIYKLANRRLELSRIVDLEDLPRARFATRSPAGRVVPIDIDGNGSRELLVGSNLLEGGAVVWLQRDHVSFRLLDFQPLERTVVDGKTAFLCGRYRTGEDTFEDSIFLADADFTISKLADVRSTKSIYRLDGYGRELIVSHPIGRAALWQPSESPDRQPLDGVGPEAVFGGPAGHGAYLLAEPAAGGFRVMAADCETHTPFSTAILTALDIEALAAYNPPGPAEKAVAVCGKDSRGEIVLALYSWPW